jgi:NAD(P)-dependent dehydrogenase (short-subunit alcohol dehydrogenase family)
MTSKKLLHLGRICYFCTWQVTYDQLLLNPPGQECSKGKWLSGAMSWLASFFLRHVKTILVTGGTSGIGKAIAQELLQFNFQVIISGRSVENGPTTIPNLHQVQLDASKPESIENMAAYLKTTFGNIDGIVNNAGIGIMAPVLETEQAKAKHVFEVNFWGPLAICNALYPILNSGASIINITSIAGNFGLPYRGYYSASKAALDCATESLKMELRNMGIRVFALQPGDIQTNIAGGREMADLQEKSPFKAEFDFSVTEANEHVKGGLPPQKVAQKVVQLIQKGGNKGIYRVAPFLQRITPLVKALLPQKTLRNMILKHHQLK